MEKKISIRDAIVHISNAITQWRELPPPPAHCKAVEEVLRIGPSGSLFQQICDWLTVHKSAAEGEAFKSRILPILGGIVRLQRELLNTDDEDVQNSYWDINDKINSESAYLRILIESMAEFLSPEEFAEEAGLNLKNVTRQIKAGTLVPTRAEAERRRNRKKEREVKPAQVQRKTTMRRCQSPTCNWRGTLPLDQIECPKCGINTRIDTGAPARTKAHHK
ncbi:MAG: hypothetical protein IT446_14805 [Phycisphaerales bacterium]|nr:hypothetical protein [Phycisphaerales bacterium]